MGSFAPIRDEGGGIIGMQETRFAQTLAETMAAIGAGADEEAPPKARYRPGKWELVGMVGGLILAAILIAALNTFWPERAPHLASPTAAPRPTAAPTIRPTPTMATQAAYDAPGGSLMGGVPLTSTISFQDSAHPGWGGIEWENDTVVWVQTGEQGLVSLPDLRPIPTREPAPPQQPVAVPAAAPVVCTFSNAPYVAVREVVIDGIPVEQVRAASCVSQAEAGAKADALHDQVLAEATAAAAPAPTAAPPRAR